MYRLRLFIAGTTSRSQTTVAQLRRVCERHLDRPYELEIIDIVQRPDLAEDDRIMATPTLIRRTPAPLRRVIGDISDTSRLLAGLGVDHKSSAWNAGDEA